MAEITQRMQASAAVARKAAAEGIVVLQNKDHLLPVAQGTKAALFGIGQVHTIKGGTGSGEVNNLKSVNILEGLRSVYALNEDLAAKYQAWADTHAMVKQGLFAGGESKNYNEEMPLDDVDLAAIAAETEVAFFVVSRIAGEGEDMEAKQGTIFLTDVEDAALKAVAKAFDKTVLLLNTAAIWRSQTIPIS